MTGADDQGNAATLPDTDEAPSGDADVGLQPGDKLGRYLLGARLGAGAMGVVWSAQDPRLDRRIAIKVVHPRLARTAEASARLLREARAMAKVSHRAVVTVHDADELDGRLYIAMELVEGTTLGHLLRTRTPDELGDWRRWLELVLDAGRGLAAAHREGVLHRDFKPDNVLVDRDGRACVADFGLASLGHEPAPTTEGARDSIPLDLTRTGTLLGTPAYMSPQQLRGEPVDERADQFAFCVAAWEALHGSRPFTTNLTGVAALAALADTIETSDITLPPATSRVPTEVRKVLMRGLAADPAARWPSMTALVTALAEVGHASRRGASIVGGRRRRLWAWIAIATVATIVAGVGIWQGISTRRTNPVAAPSPSASTSAKKLFGVALRTRLALSRDGKYVVLGGARIEVRELYGSGYWSAGLTELSELASVHIEGDVVSFGHKDRRGIWTWRYRTDAIPTPPVEALPGPWYGRTVSGDVVYVPGAQPAVTIVDHGREIARWDVHHDVEMLRISPDRTRVAYFDGRRFEQRLIIRDLVNGGVYSLGPNPAFSAIAWRDDARLIYAAGTVDRPEVYQVPITQNGPGKPVLVHDLEAGWIGGLVAARDRLLYVEMGVTARTRVVERPGLAVRDLDAAAVTAPLAWTAADQFLAWNRSSHRVERESVDRPLGATSVVLPSEPANATLVDDVLITSLRGNDGRRTIAHSLTTGKPLWEHPDLQTLAVRCVADTRPPCFAIRVGGGPDRIQHIAPLTGTLGAVVYEAENLDDLAIDPSGKRIIVATSTSVIDFDVSNPTMARKRIVPLTATRSVAFDVDGGLLTAGTVARSKYQSGKYALDGSYSVLVQSENDILSMVRPSPDGRYVLLLSRSYAPALWHLQVPH